MRRRHGITLIEVLAAIFIMGVGMMAILVLFPLGALSMARALRDDRSANCARNARALATMHDLRNDPNVAPWLSTTPPAGAQPDPLGPSFPVYVDPYYYLGLTGAQQTNLSSNVRRVSPSYVTSAAVPIDAANRWFGMLDDLTFGINGYPKQERQGLFTWAYLLRRTQSINPESTELSVIVYNGRSIQVPIAETTYGVVAGTSAGDTSLTVTWAAGQDTPELGRGSWLLDVTPAASGKSVNACFYRVTVVSEPVGGQIQVEVQPPLKNAGLTQVVWLAGAIDVYEQGIGK